MSYCLTYLTPASASILSSLCPVPMNELDQAILIGKANPPSIFHSPPVFIRQWYDSGNSHLLGHNYSCLMECTPQYTNCYYFSRVKNKSDSFCFILLRPLEIKFSKRFSIVTGFTFSTTFSMHLAFHHCYSTSYSYIDRQCNLHVI